MSGFKRNKGVTQTLKIGANNPDEALEMTIETLKKWGFRVHKKFDEHVNHWILAVQNDGIRKEGMWRIHYLIKSNSFAVHKHMRPGYVGDYSRVVYKSKSLTDILEHFREYRKDFLKEVKKKITRYQTILDDSNLS